MPRPKLFYVVYDMGRAVRIAHGHAEALRANSAYRPFKTQAAAEEAAAWHNYQQDLSASASRPKQSTERGEYRPQHQKS